MPWLYNFFLKTVICIHILYIYTLKKKNLILLALMVEGEKKSSSFIKTKKKTLQEETDVRLYNFVGIKMRCSHSSSILNWQTMVWNCLHLVAFVGCKTWQILSDEALGDTLHCPFFGGFCCKYLSLTIAHSYRQWLSLDGPGVTLLTKDWTSLSLWC